MLVGRRLELELAREFGHPLAVGRARLAAQLLPLRIQREELRRDLDHVLRRLGLAILPRLTRAQPVEADGLELADLLFALEQLDVALARERHVERPVLELDLERLLGHPSAVRCLYALPHLVEALEPANAVILVHHEVAATNRRRLELWQRQWRRLRCSRGRQQRWRRPGERGRRRDHGERARSAEACGEAEKAAVAQERLAPPHPPPAHAPLASTSDQPQVR